MSLTRSSFLPFLAAKEYEFSWREGERDLRRKEKRKRKQEREREEERKGKKEERERGERKKDAVICACNYSPR